MLVLIELLTQMWLRDGKPPVHTNDDPKGFNLGGAEDAVGLNPGAHIQTLADRIKAGALR
jgi:hypothetical protein